MPVSECYIILPNGGAVAAFINTVQQIQSKCFSGPENKVVSKSDPTLALKDASVSEIRAWLLPYRHPVPLTHSDSRR